MANPKNPNTDDYSSINSNAPGQPEDHKKYLKWLIIAAIILFIGIVTWLLAGSKFFKGIIKIDEAGMAELEKCVAGIPDAGLEGGGIYELKVKNEEGCTSVEIASSDDAAAKIYYSKIVKSEPDPLYPLQINFEVEHNLPGTTTADGIVMPALLKWDFNKSDGSLIASQIISDKNVSQRFYEAGSYTVTVSGEIKIGEEKRTISASKDITVQAPPAPAGVGAGPVAAIDIIPTGANQLTVKDITIVTDGSTPYNSSLDCGNGEAVNNYFHTPIAGQSNLTDIKNTGANCPYMEELGEPYTITYTIYNDSGAELSKTTKELTTPFLIIIPPDPAPAAFLNSFFADVFHSSVGPTTEPLIGAITFKPGDGIMIVTGAVEEDKLNILKIRFNGKQWDFDIKKKTICESDPAQKVRDMLKSIVNDGNIKKYLLNEEGAMKIYEEYSHIETLFNNVNGIFQKIDGFLKTNTDFILSSDFAKVQEFLGKTPLDQVKLEKYKTLLSNFNAKISEYQNGYADKNRPDTLINERFMEEVLGLKADSLKDTDCTSKYLLDLINDTPLFTLNEDGSVKFDISLMPDKCKINTGVANIGIQMKKLNGCYFLPEILALDESDIPENKTSELAKLINEKNLNLTQFLDNFISIFDNYKNSPKKNPCNFIANFYTLLTNTVNANFLGSVIPSIIVDNHAITTANPITVSKSNPLLVGTLNNTPLKQPTQGQLTTGESNFIYTPNSNFSGFDGFVHKFTPPVDKEFYLQMDGTSKAIADAYNAYKNSGKETTEAQNNKYPLQPAGLSLTCFEGEIQNISAPATSTVSFNVSPSSGYAPLAVQFTDLSQAATGKTFTGFWDFGDGSFMQYNQNSSNKNPIHTYTGAGTFTAKLRLNYDTTSATIEYATNISVATQTVSSNNNSGNYTTYAAKPQCSDGFNNDGDSYTDFSGGDPGCSSPDDNDEYNAATVTPKLCADGLDNDKDGYVDLKDPGCDNSTDNDETNKVEVVKEGEVKLPACLTGIKEITFNDIEGIVHKNIVEEESGVAYNGQDFDFVGQRIFEGYPVNNTREFRPFAAIRRDEAVKTALMTTCYLDFLMNKDKLNKIEVPFQDSAFDDDDYWAADLIYVGTHAGLLEEKNRFYPENQVTRAEFLKLLLKIYSEINKVAIPECKASKIKFVDVDKDDWFCRYAIMGKNLGISQGYKDEDGKLRLNPNKVLTRVDAAIMLWNYYVATTGEDFSGDEDAVKIVPR